MNRDKGIDLQAKVMKRIKDEKISFRSKYVFLAKKLGLRGGFILSLVLAILFFNLAFFTMKVSGNLEFLSFGRMGILAFLESFPYHWILIGLLFFLVSSTILSRYDISYKKPFKAILAVLFGIVFVLGILLAVSGTNEVIEERVSQGKAPFLQSFYRRRELWKNGLVGEVIEIRSSGLLVETGGRKRVFVQFTENILLPVGSDFKFGDLIRTVGKWDGEDFHAYVLRPTNKARRLMRGVTKGKGKAEPGPRRTHQ
ncbi:MAG: hypothetical protein V3T89_03205 [bacterium]